MKILSLAMISVGMIGLVACSKSDGGGGGGAPPAQPLTAEQRARFDRTANAVSESLTWQKKGNAPQSIAPQPTRPSGKARLTEIVNTNCEVKIDSPNMGDPNASAGPQDGTMGFKLEVVSANGQQCPIYVLNQIQMKTTRNADSITQTGMIRAKYTATGEATSLLDAQSIEFAIDLVVKGNNQSASGTIKGSGKVVLASEGAIDVGISGTLAGDANGMSSTQAFKLAYADGLVVELKMVSAQTKNDQAPREAFFINGVAVEKKEFMEYLGKLKMGAGESGGGQSMGLGA